MLNKKKRIREWCSYEGTVPSTYKSKRFRCPDCGKRFEVFLKPDDCQICNHYLRISRHKRTV